MKSKLKIYQFLSKFIKIYETEKWEEKIKRKDLKYKTKKYIYYFKQFETIRSFGESICSGKINTYEDEMDQSNLLENMVECNEKSRPRLKEGKTERRDTYESVNTLYEGRELTLNTFESGIFPIKATKSTKGEGLKILTPKKMLQRLPVTLAQVKAGNPSENLLNEIINH